MTRPALRAIPIIAVGLALAACGGSSGNSPTKLPKDTGSGVNVAGVNSGAAALVPSALEKTGAIVVAVPQSGPPYLYPTAKGHQPIGLDADIARALFPLLGLKPTVSPVPTAAMLAGLRSGAFKAALTTIPQAAPRPAGLTLVSYLQPGASLVARAPGGKRVHSVSQTCGLRVAVVSGTAEQRDVAAQGRRCAGGSAPTELTFPTAAAATAAVKSGRAQVALVDALSATAAVRRSGGSLVVTGPGLAEAPLSIAVPSNTGTLAQAVRVGLKVMLADGQFRTILRKWNATSAGIRAPVIGGAPKH